MRHRVFSICVGVLVGLGLGVGLTVLWWTKSEPTKAVLAAIIPEDSGLRKELNKNALIKVVDPSLITESVRLREDESSVIRNRTICREFGLKLLVSSDSRSFETSGKKVTTGTVKIIEVDSGALLWINEWSSTYQSGRPPRDVVVAEEVKRLAAGISP